MSSALSVNIHIILRGTRSAGYGFVALATADAAQKAVQVLDKKELDGRLVIVEFAKPSDLKDQEKKEKKSKRRPGRRGGKPVPGELSEAEANGDAPKVEDLDAPVSGDVVDAAKPKKKKKKTAVCFIVVSIEYSDISLSSARPRSLTPTEPKSPQRLLLPPLPPPKARQLRSRSFVFANLGSLALFAPLEWIRLANFPRPCFLLPTSVSMSMTQLYPHSSQTLAFKLHPLALSAGDGVNPGKARVMAS